MRAPILVLLGASLLLPLGCSGGGAPASSSPMSPVMQQIQTDWDELKRSLHEDGPPFAVGKAAALARQFEDPAITQDPRYANPGFANLNDKMIDLLTKLERHVGERSLPDVLISLDESTNQCRRCHKLHWKR